MYQPTFFAWDFLAVTALRFVSLMIDGLCWWERVLLATGGGWRELPVIVENKRERV